MTDPLRRVDLDRGAPRGRRLPAPLGVIVTGVALGLASAWAVLRAQAPLGPRAGAWQVSLLAGSPGADPWTRARVAVGGLLALNREETMYYVATADSAGQPLRARCTYRMTGTPPSARWWSITAYADDLFLFPAPEPRYSVNNRSAVLDAQGRFTLFSGPVQPAEAGSPWLPTPGDRGLLFTLRVYNPGAALQADPGSIDPPRIERVGDCR
ncbi:MAG: DUF1214 domain-containing protein [Burkholderiaceae bacterium]